MRGSRHLSPLPADFQRALKAAGLFGFFHECAYVHRAGYLGWITTAARPATRRRKIQEALVRLHEQRRKLLPLAGAGRDVREGRPSPAGAVRRLNLLTKAIS